MKAIPGAWHRAPSGALYLVIGPEISPSGRGVYVRVFWLTGHTLPQLHRTRLPPHA